MVQEASWCGYQYIQPSAQCFNLRVHAHTAKNHRAFDLQVLAISLDLIVHLRGQVGGFASITTTGTAIFRLPSGYRPQFTESCIVRLGTGFGILSIAADGTVSIATTTGTSGGSTSIAIVVGLDSVSFRAFA